LADFNDFKNCVRGEINLDLEVLDAGLFEPLMAIVDWFKNLSAKAKLLIGALATGAGFAAAKGAFADLLKKVLLAVVGVDAATLAGDLAFALGLIAASIGLVAVMVAFQVCMDRLGLAPTPHPQP
jgi:hypothetical protein